ncbi:MAG TPA: TetR/AcrR family transcriptional regulator, partial [Candidatus Synoicihabitans sp.]|nr:TetR/AcrR family transcriptional regulator [Candidatus Synoicihabitans sp.]
MGRRSDAKQRLLDAAIELIWERSYGVVTIDAICAKAGVKKGSFYYFFESKSALAVAALEANWVENVKPKWDDLFSASRPPLERIRHFFQHSYENQLALVAEYGCVLGCPCFSIGSEISTQDETIRSTVNDILQRQIRYFESTIRDAQAEGLVPAGDAASKARCLFALFEGTMGQARIQNDPAILRTLGDSALDLLAVRSIA